MKYIYEGPDGTGKSTFAAKFCSRNKGYFYYHNKQKPTDRNDNYFLLNNEIRMMDLLDEFVLDRSYIISEYVYSRVMVRDIYILNEHLDVYLNLIKEKSIYLYFFLFRKIPKQKEEDLHLPLARLKSEYQKVINKCYEKHIKTTVMYIEDLKGEK